MNDNAFKFKVACKKIKTESERMDFVYQSIFNLLADGHFKVCDDIFEHLNPKELGVNPAISLISVSKPWEKLFKHRVSFSNKVIDLAKETKPEDLEDIKEAIKALLRD